MKKKDKDDANDVALVPLWLINFEHISLLFLVFLLLNLNKQTLAISHDQHFNTVKLYINWS